MVTNLKNPKEVEEYLKNLYTEYQFGCHREANGEACHLLGDYEESVRADSKAAAAAYKLGCDKMNYGKSCTKYGGYAHLGKEVERDDSEALRYMVKGCDLNDVKGCLHGGILATSKKALGEEGREGRIKMGVEMLTKACKNFDCDSACFFLAGIYLGGLEGFVEKNLKEAYKLSLKSCETGNPYACANVSQMHKRGDGVAMNSDLADVFKKRAELLHNELRQHKNQVKFHQSI